MDKSNYLGFAILQLSMLHIYEIFYDKLQPYFGQENIRLHYLDTESFVLSMKAENNVKEFNKYRRYV